MTCENCGVEILPDDEGYALQDGGYLCVDCFDELDDFEDGEDEVEVELEGELKYDDLEDEDEDIIQ